MDATTWNHEGLYQRLRRVRAELGEQVRRSELICREARDVLEQARAQSNALDNKRREASAFEALRH